MKICIPTDFDRGFESKASHHFGSAPVFILANIEGGGLEVVKNPECHKHHESCHHVQLLKAHDVDAVVCDGLGRRALAGLRKAGIDVLVPADGTVSEIVDTVNDGKTHRLSTDGPRGRVGHRRRRRHRTGDGHGLRHRRRLRPGHGRAATTSGGAPGDGP